MKRLLLIPLVLMIFLSGLQAQIKIGPISINHGQEIEEDKEKIIVIAGEANDRIYTLATKGKNYFIKVFSSAEMELLSVNEVVLDEFNGKDVEFDDIQVLNDKIYVLGSVFDKSDDTNNLFGFEVSKEGKLTGAKKNLFSTEVTKKREQGAFYFKKSPEGNLLLILHASLFDKEELIQYEIKLIDENLNTVASHLEQIPFTDRNDLEFSITDFDVNVMGDIFLATNESYRDKDAKENIEKFEVHLFKAKNNYKKEIVKIDFTNKEVINCELMATRDGLVNLVGFYSGVRNNGRPNKELEGVYAAVVNSNTNEVNNLKFTEFDMDTKIKLLGERRAKKGKDVKPMYVTHSLIEKEDGGLILLSEYQQILVGRTSGIGPLGVTPVIYDNNEIIVTSFNPDGSVKWTNVLAKDQQAAFSTLSLGFYGFGGNANFTVGAGISIPIAVLSKGPEYLSAMPIYENGILTVIFNDNQKNIGVTDIEEIKTLGNYNKALPTAFQFDSNGSITRIDQENFEEGQLILRPRVFLRKNPKEYIIYSSRKSEDRMGRMFID